MKSTALASRLRQLARHAGARRYGGSMAYLAAEKTVRLVAGVLVAAVVARRLEPAGYGTLNYAISVPAMFVALAGMGLDALTVRELVRRPGESDELLGTAFALKLVGFALLLAATAVTAAVLELPAATRVLVWIIACGYLFNSFQVIDFYFQAQVLGKYAAVSQIAAVTAVSAARLLLAFFHAHLVWFAAAEVFYMATAAAMYALCYRRACRRSIFRWRWSGETARGLIRDAMPLLAAGVASGVYSRFDQVAVTGVLGAAANGCYAVAVRLLELCYVPAIIAADTLFPSIVGTRLTSLPKYYRRVRLLIGTMFYSSLAALPLLMAAGYLAVTLLFGSEYRLSAGLFCFFALKVPVFSATYALSKWYVAENMQKIALCSGVAAALVFVASAKWLVAVFGVWGAAGGSILLTFCAYALFPLVWRKGRLGALLLWRGVCTFPTAERIEKTLNQHKEL